MVLAGPVAAAISAEAEAEVHSALVALVEPERVVEVGAKPSAPMDRVSWLVMAVCRRNLCSFVVMLKH